MEFSVSWNSRAERELAQLWLDSASRREISSAADRIDELLRERPLSVGESRPNERRILLVHPLGVIFEVFEADLRVVVLRVWSFSKNP